jgi:hypothetical protein
VVATGAGGTQHLQATGRQGRALGIGRQVQIQQNSVVALDAPQMVGVLDIARHIDPMPRGREAAAQHVAQNIVVFDQQHTHGSSSIPIGQVKVRLAVRQSIP